MLALTEQVLVQFLASLAVVLAAVVPTLVTINRKQNQVHQENRDDHAATAALVKEIHSDVGGIKLDMFDTKADMRSVKDNLRDHGQRIHALETTPSPVQVNVNPTPVVAPAAGE